MELTKINNVVSSYIELLYNNQNNTETNHLKDLFSKKEYNNLLMDVTLLLKEEPNQDLSFYRETLLKRSGLYNLLKHFVKNSQLAPGFVITFGTKLNKDTVIYGNRQEVSYEDNHYVSDLRPMEYDTIFDLASTSKLFTVISILKLCEAGLIELHESVRKYVPEFTNMGDITIFDLLSFKVPVKSSDRIDKAQNVEEATNLVFTLEKEENHEPTFPYTDMGSIALRFVIEKMANMPLKEFIQEEIIKKCQMNDTYLNVPDELKNKVANNNYSSIIGADGRIITDYATFPGMAHDAKTKALGHAAGIAPGHAGFFSCTQDLDKLAKNIMDYNLLNKEHTLMLGQNVVGGIVTNKKGEKVYNCHHGLLTYAKQVSTEYLSAVRPFLSGKAFASPGYTGTCLCVDPLNEISTAIGTNRLHNRIHGLNPAFNDKIINHDSGKKEYEDPFTGEKKVISKPYSHKSADIIRITMRLALQYRLLEQIFNQKEEIKLVKHI